MTSRIAKSVVAVLLAGMVVPQAAAAGAKERYFIGKAGGILGTPDQLARERLAVRIFNSAAVQAEMRKLEVLYAADSTAQLPDALRTVKRAARATAMAQATAMVNHDPARPGVFWGTTSPHKWGGVAMPLTGLMIDNPDNIYRGIPVDGLAAYEISGQVVGKAPAQATFILHEVRSGADKKQKIKKQEDENGYVALDQLPLGPDGRFTITIDSTPANGRIGHIQSNPDVHNGYIIIRDTLTDWASENPTRLSVRRVSGPKAGPVPREAELVKRAAAMTSSAGPYWLKWAHERFYTQPANQFTHDVNRVSGWGNIKCGHYRLGDDEALVFVLDAKRAAYLGFQLSDAWGQGQSMDYMEGTGSLTSAQARANADGTYSYALSVKDPGVHNWLNPAGLHAGTYCARWQKLPAGVGTDDAVKRVEVVKLKDLKGIFSQKSDWVTPSQRAAQLRARVASYRRRLLL